MRGWMSGGRGASTLLALVFDISAAEVYLACCSMFISLPRSLIPHWEESVAEWRSIFHLTLPHWLSMGPFRKNLSSTDWNIISCWTSTLGLLRCAPCNSLTAAPLYLLVTQRPLVQYTYGISLQQATVARGMHAHKDSLSMEYSMWDKLLLRSKIYWTRLLDTLEMRVQHLSQVKKTEKTPPPYRAIFLKKNHQSKQPAQNNLTTTTINHGTLNWLPYKFLACTIKKKACQLPDILRVRRRWDEREEDEERKKVGYRYRDRERDGVYCCI